MWTSEGRSLDWFESSDPAMIHPKCPTCIWATERVLNQRTDKSGLVLFDCRRNPGPIQVNERDFCGEHRARPVALRCTFRQGGLRCQFDFGHEGPHLLPAPPLCGEHIFLRWTCKLDRGHHGPHSHVRGK